MKWMQGLAAAAFVAALGAGFYYGDVSWNGTVFVSDGMYNKLDGDARTPAAIRRMLDISNLEGSALTSALQNRLLSDIKVVQNKEGVGLELGHFVTHDENGEKVFACHYYSRVELTFVADGVIEAGERPTMTVEGSCNYSTNINRIDPIMIPVAKILNERPGQPEYMFGENDPVTLRFRSVGASWPKNWSLYAIRLFDQDNKEHEVTIGETEMRKQFPHLVTVNF